MQTETKKKTWWDYGFLPNSENAMEMFVDEAFQKIIESGDTDATDIVCRSLMDAWYQDNAPGRYMDEIDWVLGMIGGYNWPAPPPPPKCTRYVAYRGVTDLDDWEGMSWTLDLKVAEFFAYDYPRRPSRPAPGIIRAEIDPSWVWFYAEERKEQELVLWPWAVEKLGTKWSRWKIISKDLIQ